MTIRVKVSEQKPKETDVSERLDRIDRYCNELEDLIRRADGDDDITGQIERSAAGLERMERKTARG
jgi:hypothetical protein